MIYLVITSTVTRLVERSWQIMRLLKGQVDHLLTVLQSASGSNSAWMSECSRGFCNLAVKLILGDLSTRLAETTDASVWGEYKL